MITKLYVSDFPDRKYVPDGYDLKEVPELSAANIEVIRVKINEIIAYLNDNPIPFLIPLKFDADEDEI